MVIDITKSAFSSQQKLLKVKFMPKIMKARKDNERRKKMSRQEKERKRQEFTRRLNEVLDWANVKKDRGRIKEVAKMFNVSEGAARKWLTAGAIPQATKAMEITNETGTRYEYLMTGRGSMVENNNIVVIGQSASGGTRKGVIVDKVLVADTQKMALHEQKVGMIKVFPGEADCDRMQIVGNSISPRGKSGDCILISQEEAKNGDEVLIQTTNNEYYIKEYLFTRSPRVHVANVLDERDRDTFDDSEIVRMCPIIRFIPRSQVVPLTNSEEPPPQPNPKITRLK